MKFALPLGLVISLAACTDPSEPLPGEALAPAVNPHVGIRNANPTAVLAKYTVRPVKGPEDWRRLNDRQSPANQEEN